MYNGWYWVDTGWACGGMKVKEDKIVDSCPIFRRFIGQSAKKVFSCTRYKCCSIAKENKEVL